MKREYTILGGWNETEWIADKKEAMKIATGCQKGNANLSLSPEEWAKEKILSQKDFRCFKSPELCYIFKFESK